MTKKTQRLHQFAKLPLAVAVAATMSTPASAFQFYMGDLEASFDTTLSAGASWRVSDRNDDLVGQGNGGDGGAIGVDGAERTINICRTEIIKRFSTVATLKQETSTICDFT